MDGRNEQRVAIKFCLKAGQSVTETLVLVPKAYGKEALYQSHLFSWYRGADKSLARPGRKQANVSVRMV